MKFKVGDRVKVISKSSVCSDCGNCYVGEIGLIRNIYNGVELYVTDFTNRIGGCSGFRKDNLKLIGGGSMSKGDTYYNEGKNVFFQVREKTLSGAKCSDFCIYYGDAKTANVTQKLSNNFILNSIRVDNINFFPYARWDGIDYIATKEAKMSKYDELKDRIQAVEGWTKEADDILEELYCEDTRIKQHFLKISMTSKDSISILGYGYDGEELAKFKHTSQCEKLEAFKQALMYLLDHSDIKKDEKQDKIKEIKAEIKGLQDRIKELEV